MNICLCESCKSHHRDFDNFNVFLYEINRKIDVISQLQKKQIKPDCDDVRIAFAGADGFDPRKGLNLIDGWRYIFKWWNLFRNCFVVIRDKKDEVRHFKQDYLKPFRDTNHRFVEECGDLINQLEGEQNEKTN